MKDAVRWGARAAALLALAALWVLVAVPFTVQRRLAVLRGGADRADLARTEATRVQFAMVRQMTALQGAVLAPDPRWRVQYQQAHAQERAALAAIDAALRGFPPRARASLAVLRARSAGWHGRVTESVLLRPESAARAVRGTDLVRFEAMLRAARDLDLAIASDAREIRGEIARAEQRANRLAVAMVVAAALVATVLGWLAFRMRRLARVAAAHGAEAERALASRERLIRSVTHDLKNPIGAAGGYVDLLCLGAEDGFSPEQRKMLEGIRRCHATVLATIEDLLDFSRAEAGELPLDLELVDCRTVIREVVEEYGGAARAGGHELDLAVGDAAIAATIDTKRVARILENLLTNAIRYTPAPGRVGVTACTRTDGAGPAPGWWVEIRVADSGPGIPPGQREHVFAEFVRLGTGSADGHGLGLATSRRVARLLGGDLTVSQDAALGGAAFSLWLPAAVQPSGNGKSKSPAGRPAGAGGPEKQGVGERARKDGSREDRAG